MVYWITYYLFKFIMKVFFRGVCYDRDNLPVKGPFIGVINHNSILDFLAMALVVRHKASAMVKHSLFSVPILGWWLRTLHMFPVVRGTGDREAFDYALGLLKKGYVLFMAPEGTRKYDPDNPPRARTGFIRLAQLVNCPVVPIAITGTREALPPGTKFPRFVKVRAKVGKPIQLEKIEVNLKNREKLQQQAQEAMAMVYQLRDELLAMDGVRRTAFAA
ncbi:MAG: lysophospholipid acyltransferase family protein [bacterium]